MHISAYRRFLDQALLVLSAAFFYVNSAIASYGTRETLLTPGYFTFARSFVGAAVLFAYWFFRHDVTRSREAKFLVARAVTYFFALATYFEAVARLGPALGNTLNLTYPLILAFAGFLLSSDRKSSVGIAFAAIAAFVGIIAVLQPTASDFNLHGSLIGLASGCFGALAVASLRRTRASNSSATVLFYLFGISLPLSLLFFWRELFWPSAFEFQILFWSSLAGVVGQFFLALGSKYLSAAESGIISQSRILIAAVFGVVLDLDPPLGIAALCGLGLIFAANVYLVARKS